MSDQAAPSSTTGRNEDRGVTLISIQDAGSNTQWLHSPPLALRRAPKEGGARTSSARDVVVHDAISHEKNATPANTSATEQLSTASPSRSPHTTVSATAVDTAYTGPPNTVFMILDESTETGTLTDGTAGSVTCARSYRAVAGDLRPSGVSRMKRRVRSGYARCALRGDPSLRSG